MANMPYSYCAANTDQFPCNKGAIVLVSLGLAAAGLGLVMVAYLMNSVSFSSSVISFCLDFLENFDYFVQMVSLTLVLLRYLT